MLRQFPQRAVARVVVFLVCLAGAHVWAQTNVGRISGTVYDATGAAIPDCIVSAANVQTGLQQSVRTEETGFYVFPSLPVGSYRLAAEKEGFRKLERTGIILDAASRRSVDFRLEVGAVAESIEVLAAAEQVQGTSGEVSRLITGSQVSELALNGRNYVQLLRLIPGTVATSTNPFTLGLGTTQQRINGVRSNSIYFTVDGADNMDNGANSNAIINPNIDAISEIKILTAGYSAEFGGRSGAIVNVVTKSGTREFHGSLFEFVRNDRFDARSFFARGIDPLRFNDFGWTLGGPIFIPNRFNTDRNRLFFFAAQEWKYSHQGETRVGVVPTASERAGDFRNSTLPAPNDPTSGLPFPDRTVPASSFSRNGPALLKPYPLPNFGGPGGNYSATGVNRTDTREDMLKIDYVLPKTQIMYRWTHDEFDIFNAWQGSNLGIVPGARPRPGYTTIASVSHTFSPTTLNYFSFSVTHNQIQGGPRNEIMRRDTLGLTYPEIYPANMSGIGPNVTISGFTAYNAGDRIRNANSTFQWRDDFSKVMGPHALKFGVQITRSRKNENLNNDDQGEVNFNTSARNTTGNALADVLLGNFQNYSEPFSDGDWWSRFSQFEFYAQDSWRVNRRLSLEIGVRYSLIGPVYSALGNYATFLPGRYDPGKAPEVSTRDGALTADTGDPYNGIAIFGSAFPAAARGRLPEADDPSLERLFIGLPKGGFYRNYRDFGPRFGFAYDPFGQGKTSIRGGLGIFFDQYRTGYPSNLSANPPFNREANVFDGNIDNPGGGTARRFPPNLRSLPTRMGTPAVTSFNFGVQHEAPGGVIVDVGYVGTLGRHLARRININQLPVGTRLNPPNSTINVNALRPYMGYADIDVMDSGDNSNYNSLQVALNRRLQQGLSFGVSYTFSRALDYAPNENRPQDSYNARPDYGLSPIHRAQCLTFNYIYELPFFRRHGNRVVRNAFGGWEVSGITSYQSGAPNNVTVPVDVARIGVASSRATVIADPRLPKSERRLDRWFNTEAFLPPERMVPGQFGNVGKNTLIGPGFEQWDLAVLKNFQITERSNLQFRAESFNVWNHPSFTGINTTVRFGANGRPIQNYGAVNGSGPGRVLEFGLKLMF
jgi:hypothetical protein